MPNFCVNKNAQSNGDHEVHDLASTRGCLPTATNRIDLGYHPGCGAAVSAARRYYGNVNGCYYCANACHTS